MTKQEQVKEILEVIKHCGDYTNRDCAECDYRLYGECKNQKQCEAEALYNEGYRKVPFGATVLAPEERNDEIREMHEILEGRDELIAKVGILGRENYDLKAEIKHLNTIVERLDELLGKGINDYIMGIDGVEGLKDMWERSAVMEFAEKLKKYSYTDNYFTDGKWHRYVLVSDIDELLKEYEK